MHRLNGSLKILLLLILLFIGCSGSDDAVRRDRPVDTGSSDIVNLSQINSADDDFAPYLAQDKAALIFTSNRPAAAGKELIDDKSRYGEVLYSASGGGATWQNPQPVSPIAVRKFNHGTFTELADGSEVYFGASYIGSSIGGTDIFRMKRAVGQWTAPEPVRELSSKWWDSHPALSPDGSMMVFASDRDLDDPTAEVSGSRTPTLWVSDRTAEGNWAAPQKLPSPLNSDSTEISPFFSVDGYLYFATGRYAFSGLDIVRSKRNASGWGDIERLASPVNSPEDDVFPCVSSDRNSIYFASNRPGGKGGLDLYAAGFPYIIRLRGTITRTDDKGTVIAAMGIPITVEDLGKGTSRTVVSGNDGTYSTTLEAGKKYRVSIGTTECYGSVEAAQLTVAVPFRLDTTLIRDFNLERNVFPSFQLGRYNIPFFVTGYYHPNTNANLDRLKSRLESGELNVRPGGNTPYIDNNDEDYRSHADRIETIFDSVYTTIGNSILPLFDKCALADEVLRIEVRGFVDPRGLSYGIYVDKTVTTENMRIEKGSLMALQEGNTKLANLRAFYTMEMLDTELSARFSRYRDLKAAARVVLVAYGEGIDTETEGSRMQDPAKRRIDIKLLIASP